jgi:hypothetical protein
MNPMHTQPYYQQIRKLLNNLSSSNVLPKLQGQCIAAADLVQNLLYQHGIHSKILEVQLTATKHYPDGNTEFVFVGYDNLMNPGQVDTHLVVITETDIPLLIDVSIGHILQGSSENIVLKTLNTSDLFLADYRIDDVQLTYTIKKSIRLPNLHQRTLIDRMIEERKIKETIYWLKILTITGLGIGVFNILANATIIMLKLLS